MSSAASIIPEEWSLPAEILEQIGEFASRQREISAQGHHVLILHQVPAPGNSTRLSVLLWRNTEGQWRAIWENANDLPPVIGDARSAMVRLLHEYDKRIDELEELYGEARTAKDLFQVLRETIPVLRAMKNLVRPLAAAREHMPKAREILIWREEAYGAERAIELLYDEARAALDFASAEEAERQSVANLEMAAATHRLNLMVALFLPMTAIGAAFGMNIPSGLEDSSKWLFWLMGAFGLLVGISLRGFIAWNKPPLEALRKPRIPFFHILTERKVPPRRSEG